MNELQAQNHPEAENLPVFVQVTDQRSYELGCEIVAKLKQLRTRCEARHRPVIDQAPKIHKLALARALQSWNLEQDRIRREEQERLRREEEEAAKQLAAEARESGQEVTVEEILPTQVTLPPARAAAVSTAAGKVTTVGELHVRIMDEAAVIRAVAAGSLPADCLKIHVGPLKAWAKATGRRGEVHGLLIEEGIGIRVGGAA